MVNKGMYTLPGTNDSVWLSNSVQALFIGEAGNGTYRVVTTANEFDFLDPSDTTIARVWTFSELSSWFVQNVPYSDYAETVSGANTTITWNAGGATYTATGNNIVDVLASTILQYLPNAPQGNNRTK